MSIVREGRFLLNHDLGITSALGIESDQLEACVAEVRARHLRGVFGAGCFGFRENNLDFLAELPWLEQIWFFDTRLERIEGLYALRALRYFGVQQPRPPIDFGRLPHLETIVWSYGARDENLDALRRARALHCWHYNPKSKSYRDVQLPPHLEHLEFNWANPATLEGLPALSQLRRLEFHRCRQLATLAGVARVAPRLEELIVTTCGRLSPAEVRQALPPSVQVAIVNGQRIAG